jgi:hypothetical protein
MDLPPIKTQIKFGNEQFKKNNTPINFTLSDFWRWSCSDLVSNATRGKLAEFLVATALGISVTMSVRDEWSAWDLTTPEGIKVEVKSAAYVQSWHQEDLSKISFLVPKTRAWSPETNRQEDISERHADVYVFALLAHQDKPTIDPLELSQWQFYVIPTEKLNKRERSQHSITLPPLEKLCGNSIPYNEIRSAVLGAAKK